MEKIITYDNIRSFAYVNDAICQKPIRGIVVFYGGLGDMDMFDEETNEGRFYGEKGILYVIPYKNPWSWMNHQTVLLVDEILDVLMQRFSPAQELPVVLTGVSMGGQSALVYAVHGRYTPAACVVNCPVCDMILHFSERKDLPRTLYSAVSTYSGTLEEALKTISPIHLTNQMPNVQYHIFHCEKDSAVSITEHSERFVAKMQEKGYHITYDVVPGQDHCALTVDMEQKYKNYILNCFITGK